MEPRALKKDFSQSWLIFYRYLCDQTFANKVGLDGIMNEMSRYCMSTSEDNSKELEAELRKVFKQTKDNPKPEVIRSHAELLQLVKNKQNRDDFLKGDFLEQMSTIYQATYDADVLRKTQQKSTLDNKIEKDLQRHQTSKLDTSHFKTLHSSPEYVLGELRKNIETLLDESTPDYKRAIGIIQNFLTEDKYFDIVKANEELILNYFINLINVHSEKAYKLVNAAQLNLKPPLDQSIEPLNASQHMQTEQLYKNASNIFNFLHTLMSTLEETYRKLPIEIFERGLVNDLFAAEILILNQRLDKSRKYIKSLVSIMENIENANLAIRFCRLIESYADKLAEYIAQQQSESNQITASENVPLLNEALKFYTLSLSIQRKFNDPEEMIDTKAEIIELTMRQAYDAGKDIEKSLALLLGIENFADDILNADFASKDAIESANNAKKYIIHLKIQLNNETSKLLSIELDHLNNQLKSSPPTRELVTLKRKCITQLNDVRAETIKLHHSLKDYVYGDNEEVYPKLCDIDISIVSTSIQIAQLRLQTGDMNIQDLIDDAKEIISFYSTPEENDSLPPKEFISDLQVNSLDDLTKRLAQIQQDANQMIAKSKEDKKRALTDNSIYNDPKRNKTAETKKPGKEEIDSPENDRQPKL